MAFQQTEELVDIGHRSPLLIDGLRIDRDGGRRRIVGGLQCQRRVFCKDETGQQRCPFLNEGILRGIDLQQRITLMVEELNALTLTMGGCFADMKGAGPLIQEQTQIEGARIENQPSMAVEVLIGKSTHLLMYCVFIAANTFGFANCFQCAENFTHFAT